MWRQRLFWKLFSTYSLIIVFCMAVVGGYLVRGERRASRVQLESALSERAILLDERLAPWMSPGRGRQADSLVKFLGRRTESRITVIEPDGTVLADTEGDPAQMENHRFRPEVQAALAGRVGTSERWSASVFKRYLYVAIPSHFGRGWVIRVSIPLVQFERSLQRSMHILIVGTVSAAALAIFLGFVFIRLITRPLDGVRRGLERLERGEFGVRLEEQPADEIGQLARTLNRVQERLEGTIQSLTSQRNEREAILSSMTEGLIAVDGENRLLLVNAAARALLGLGSAAGEGRLLLEVVRIPQVVQFIDGVRAAAQAQSSEILLPQPGPRLLELHGAPLRLGDQGASGAVVVFTDVTRLRKLERVRRDFVANVSHELKTPVTTIKGSLETLLDGGAMKEAESAQRFLGIITKQTDRLAAIIEDLLYLSRLEYEEKEIPLQPIDLGAVAEHCVGDFESLARSRGIDLRLRLESEQRCLLGDASLVARAVDNLIDNAIKYSPAGGRVEVVLRDSSEGLSLQVTDQGIGIPEQHLARISERFYRVDTARSRELGGTGLGLAIVKHIAQVHSGSLHVDSRLGEGSCFTLSFPHLEVG